MMSGIAASSARDSAAVSTAAGKKIVVVGAGFGGMAAVQALKGVDAEITLVDRTNHHLFQPLLYQVATAALSPAEIATASRVLLRRYRNATVLMANVSGVDVNRRVVQLDNGMELSYDFLVLATGAAYSFFGHDEWAPYTHVLKTLDDALSIRERLLSAFEWAEESNDPEQVRRLMTLRSSAAVRPESNWPAPWPSWRARPWRGISSASIRGRRASCCARPVRGCCRRFRSLCRITP